MATAADIAPDLPRWHLAIGECIVTRRHAVINTVLGSCVAVTFHHKQSRLAAIFHAMLPDCNGQAPAFDQPCKYVTTATRRIMGRFKEAGAHPDAITAKLFGGAFSLGEHSCQKTRAMIDVGAQNVAMAERELEFFGLRISSRDTHGVQGRKLFFDTASGDVWLRPLPKISKESLRKAVSEVGRTPLLDMDHSTFVIK